MDAFFEQLFSSENYSQNTSFQLYDIAWSPAHPAVFVCGDGQANIDLLKVFQILSQFLILVSNFAKLWKKLFLHGTSTLTPRCQ